MLLFPHYVALSPIHGLGCFSSVNIKKGERIWEFHPVVDRVITQSEISVLPAHIAKIVQTHAEFIPEQAVFRLAADGDFFMNHSDDPNLEDFRDFAIARRDIAIGDEVTCDYRIVKVWSLPLGELDGPRQMEWATDMQRIE